MALINAHHVTWPSCSAPAAFVQAPRAPLSLWTLLSLPSHMY